MKYATNPRRCLDAATRVVLNAIFSEPRRIVQFISAIYWRKQCRGNWKTFTANSRLLLIMRINLTRGDGIASRMHIGKMFFFHVNTWSASMVFNKTLSRLIQQRTIIWSANSMPIKRRRRKVKKKKIITKVIKKTWFKYSFCLFKSE